MSYVKNQYGSRVAFDFLLKPGKDISRKIALAKSYKDVKELDSFNPDDYHDISVLVYTNPRAAGLGKKKPEIFELKLGGAIKEKLDFVKANADKDLTIDQVFKEGQFVDVHAVTKGKGTQGPVARFRIGLKPHKSEKGRRQPGSRGGWSRQQHVMYRTAYSGQMGFHQRVHYNTQVYKISAQPAEVNPKDGFPHYGVVKSMFLLVKGSVPGVRKRLLILTQPMRPPIKEGPLANLTHISLESKQGR
jgi:large subunit ribosomal protein L3